MRTLDEIVEHYRSTMDEDQLGFTAEVLLPYLPFDRAQRFLKPAALSEDWPDPAKLSRDSILAEMKDYMNFAWGKVEDHRGISASCSVEKMCAWLWLLDDDDTMAFAKSDDDQIPTPGTDHGLLGNG